MFVYFVLLLRFCVVFGVDSLELAYVLHFQVSDRRYHGYLLHMIFTSFNHFELLVIIRDQGSR